MRIEAIHPKSQEFLEYLGRTNNYHAGREFSNATYGIVYNLMFHWTLIRGAIGDTHEYHDQFCFKTREMAVEALFTPEWDGTGDAPGLWHKHRPTGRVRIRGVFYPDIQTAHRAVGEISVDDY